MTPELEAALCHRPVAVITDPEIRACEKIIAIP